MVTRPYEMQRAVRKPKEEKMTINEVLVHTKIIRERLNDLKDLRARTSVRTSYLGTDNKVIEPEYDVKKLDKKIVELQNFLALADAKVKTSNAVTHVAITPTEIEILLAPLE